MKKLQQGAKDRLKEKFAKKKKNKQTRQARARHAAKCSLMPGKRTPKGRPLKEVYVDATFTEDRNIWKEELQRHCEEIFEDVAETIEIQEDMIKKCNEDGDRHFTEEGIIAVTHKEKGCGERK